MPAFQPIGLIRSPFTRQEQTPIQPYRSQAAGRVEVLPDLIGLSVVRLVRREGAVLHMAGIDVLDGTPSSASPGRVRQTLRV